MKRLFSTLTLVACFALFAASIANAQSQEKAAGSATKEKMSRAFVKKQRKEVRNFHMITAE